jgi:hypothetical protein
VRNACILRNTYIEFLAEINTAFPINALENLDCAFPV